MRLMFVGLALMSAPVLAQTPPPPPTTADRYVPAAAAGDLYEQQSSQIVLRDAKRADVRRFAQMMISDHTNTTKQVAAAAQRSSVPVPPSALMPHQQAMIEQLNAAPADQREQVYLTQQVAAHQEALAIHQTYASSGDKPALKTVAGSAVPIVQRHLAEVQRLAGSK